MVVFASSLNTGTCLELKLVCSNNMYLSPTVYYDGVRRMPAFFIRLTKQSVWSGADLGGGFRGLQPPPPPPQWSESQYTTDVLRYAQALIYIAKSLVVVVVSSKQVVKPLSRLAVVQPEVLHLLECLLGHSTVLGRGN